MPHSHNKQAFLDIEKCSFNEEGVNNFWWPFHSEELRSFANDAMHLYADTIGEFDADDSLAFHPYRLLSKFMIADFVGLFQADALFQRALQEDVQLVVPQGTRFWPLVQKGRVPDPDDVLNGLRRGPVKTSLFKKLLNVRRVLKVLSKMKKHESGGGISLGDLKIAPITKKILQENIIATERTKLMNRHVRHVKSDVYFQRSDKWYTSVSKEEEKRSVEKNNIEFEKKLLDGISNIYKKYDVKFSDQTRKFYQTLLSQGSAILRVHFERLLKEPDKLPRKVWIGTGGQIWDMMLCLAVREQGGYSCGHDHATGSGHCAMPSISFVDLWGFDQFFTFNDTKVKGIEQITKGMPFLERRRPTVCCPPLEYDNKQIKKIAKVKEPIKKIIVMSPPYDRDRGRPSPIMPDIIRTDWQCKLLKFLTKNGYEVVLKVHPESKVFPPDDIEVVTGAEISTEPFEKMMQEGDVVLFDHIYTSTFRAALETDMPLVIVKAVDFYLTKEAEDSLKKRAEFVSVSYNADNRLEVDWCELKEAINKSQSKNTFHDFANTHLAD